MEQKKIDRINELAKKKRTVGLTDEELAVRAANGDDALQYMQQTEELFRFGSVLGG